MKREGFQFVDEPLRNVHTSEQGKVLQLCLRKNTTIARRRMQESSMVLVLSGQLRMMSKEQEAVLRPLEAVILDSAEEHCAVALEDSVVLLTLFSNHQIGLSQYERSNGGDSPDEDWKERIVPELRVLAFAHERVLGALNVVEPYDLVSLDEAMKATSVFVSRDLEVEEKRLFPLLAPYLGGQDVGPIPRLIAEHNAIREQFDKCKKLRSDLTCDSGHIQALFQAVDALTNMVVSHMDKEDFHLLPMAGRLLSEEDLSAFLKDWGEEAW